MNGNIILKEMSGIDENLIREAEKIPKRKVKKKYFIEFGASLAAALAITFGVTHLVKSMEEPPLLVLSGKNVINLSNGSGYEGIHAGDPSELENGNPWSEEMKIKKLPVFSSSSLNPNEEKMKKAILEAAEFLGLDTDSLTIESNLYGEAEIARFRETWKGYGVPDEEIERMLKNTIPLQTVEAKQNGVSLTVDTAFTITIRFENGVVLPDGYDFGKNASREERQKTGAYLLEKYGGLLNMKKPTINLDGIYKGSIEYYDAGSSNQDQLVNYSLNILQFSPNGRGELYLIRIHTNNECEKIADYPILTAEKAKQQLADGNYLSSVPYKLTGNEKIGKTEIIYLSGLGYEYVMPYYRFLVKLPAEFESESTYGCYYVPAVEGKYLVGMELDRIRFNE